MCVCVCVCVREREREREIVAQSSLTLCDHMNCSPPGSSVHGQEYWSGLPFPSPGNLPKQGISLALQAYSLKSNPPREAHKVTIQPNIHISTYINRTNQISMKNLSTNFHSCIIHNSQKMGKHECPRTAEWINKM